MKRIITTLLCAITACIYAESWQPVHTFEKGYNQLVFNGEEFLCLASSFDYDPFLYKREVVKSPDLINWTSYTNLTLDLSSLVGGEYDFMATDNEDVTFEVSRISTTGTDSNKYIAIISRVWSPPGNISDHSLLSAISTNGVDWVNVSYITSAWPDEAFDSIKFENRFLLAVRSLGWPFGIVNWRATLHTYSSESNSWVTSADVLTSPYPESCDLFSDQSTIYLSYKDGYNGYTGTVVSSSNGTSWETIRVADSSFVSGADAYGGQIISPAYVFSKGLGWERRSFGDVRNLIFNGNRIAGNNSDSLLYSDDFGQTWQSANVEEITDATIIEANRKFVALVSSSTNSSIYTINAYPNRASVAEIIGFGATTDGLGFQSASNALYQLECTTSLMIPDWQAYGMPKVGTGSNVFIGRPENLISNIFFRVKAVNN